MLLSLPLSRLYGSRGSNKTQTAFTVSTTEVITLANIQSAKKRIRQTEKRTAHNRSYVSAARTYVKKTRQFIADGDLEKAEATANMAYKTLDKAARKHVIHPRNAARRKGRLMAALEQARQAS
jgi:small subunit ribosomal protein S20